jgi:hypothetical protein
MLVAGAKFCSECGVKVGWCGQCNNALVDDANFCSACGAKVSGNDQSSAISNATGRRATNRQAVSQHAIDAAQETGEWKNSHEKIAQKAPRAGWHIVLIWLLAFGVTFATIHSSVAGSIITENELARAAGISFWPAFIAWIASRLGHENPRFCAWGAGLMVMFVSLLATAQYQA